MDTVLMNRLDGDSVGPVKVLVSNPVYSHDGQHVLDSGGNDRAWARQGRSAPTALANNAESLSPFTE